MTFRPRYLPPTGICPEEPGFIWPLLYASRGCPTLPRLLAVFQEFQRQVRVSLRDETLMSESGLARLFHDQQCHYRLGSLPPPLVNAKTMTLEAREDGRYPAQGGHPAP